MFNFNIPKEQVQKLQQDLVERGHSISVDNKLGQQTYKALIKEVQSAINKQNENVSGYIPLKVDGIAGSKTEKALKDMGLISNTNKIVNYKEISDLLKNNQKTNSNDSYSSVNETSPVSESSKKSKDKPRIAIALGHGLRRDLLAPSKSTPYTQAEIDDFRRKNLGRTGPLHDDPGAVLNNNMTERDLLEQLQDNIRAIQKDYGDEFEIVIITGQTVTEKLTKAHNMKADYFLELHYDSANPKVSGPSTLYDDRDSEDKQFNEQLTLNLREDLGYSSATHNNSKAFAYGIFNRNGSLGGLEEHTMRRSIVELGNTRNESDLRRIQDDKYQQKMILSLCKNVRTHYKNS